MDHKRYDDRYRRNEGCHCHHTQKDFPEFSENEDHYSSNGCISTYSNSLKYRRTSEEFCNSTQNLPNKSERRHSVSEVKLDGHFNSGHRNYEDYSPFARTSLSSGMESFSSSTPRTPNSDMKRSFEFPYTPKRSRSSSFSMASRKRTLSSLAVKFDDVLENSKNDCCRSPKVLFISPGHRRSSERRTLNNVSRRSEDVFEGAYKTLPSSPRSFDKFCFTAPSRHQTTSSSGLVLENVLEDSTCNNWNLSATNTTSGRSPVKEVRSRRRRLDSLNLDPPRLSNTSLPQDDQEDFHFRNFFHVRDVFQLHERLRALEWRTYLPTNYFQTIAQTHVYGDSNLEELSAEDAALNEETIVEGQELYLHFFHEQLRKAGIERQIAAKEEEGLASYHTSSAHVNESELVLPSNSSHGRTRKMSMNLENFQNPIWRQTGRDLKILADEFANSVERIHVQQRAEQVIIESLNREKFFDMLNELFQGGRVTRERILVLFFFCSDVAIRAVKNNSEGWLSTLTQWSLIFIKEQVCFWVYKNGGWQTVLKSGFNLLQQTFFIGACVAVIVCSAIYIRKNLISTNQG